jgi:hypothetical protein
LLFALLLALAMTADAYATATAQARVCCASDECSVIECLEMGCLPVASSLAAHRLVGFLAQVSDWHVPLEISHSLPTRYEEIFTPPG